jgi:hypothetical protein
VARHGVNGAAPSFLQKPFTGQELAKKVRDVLGTGRPTRPVVLQ